MRGDLQERPRLLRLALLLRVAEELEPAVKEHAQRRAIMRHPAPREGGVGQGARRIALAFGLAAELDLCLAAIQQRR